MNHQKYDTNGLIVLWALAESGIGGLLHALHLPLTGIFVGGFAVIAISLLAWYSDSPKEILKALSIVLAVKLIVSPHSPWQAYVAVAFQGLLGYWLYYRKNQFKIKIAFFTVLCLLESALQKILIAVLVFGTDFFKAIDKAAMQIAQSLGFDLSTSLVMTVFLIYAVAHLAVGIFLAWYIPTLPKKIDAFTEIASQHKRDEADLTTNKKRKWWLIYGIIGISILGLNYLLPVDDKINLTLLVTRVIVVTLILTFVVGPLIKWAVLKYLVKDSPYQHSIAEVLAKLPTYQQRMMENYRLATHHYQGYKALTFFILGMLVFSLKSHER